MNDDLNDEMIDEFKIEAAEMFETSEEGFLNIEKGENFLNNFNLIFRAFHSLKGAAGMFGLQDLQAHMHKLESLFEAQKPNGSIGKKQIDYFLEGIDSAKALLDGKSSHFNHLSLKELESLNPNSTAALKAATQPEVKSNSAVQNLETKKKKTTKGLIFIVDDEQNILDILEAFVLDLNFEVKTFLTAESVLEALTEFTPDIILTDISMPGMDGISMVKAIRQINQVVTFIMVSGNITKERVLDLIKYDVSGFIEKPFQEEEVKAIIERAFTVSQLNTLLNKSINYILYQFSDLDSYLKQIGKENIRVTLKEELKNIIRIQNELTEKKKLLK